LAGLLQRLKEKLFGRKEDRDSSSPVSVLEEYNKKLFDSTERLAKRHLELNQVRVKLQAHADKLRAFLRKYDDQARKYYQTAQMELVEAALKEKLQHKAELEKLNESISELDRHIESLRANKERMQGQLQLFKIKREAIELRYDASKTELETKELQMGLSETEIPDVENAIKEAESELQSIQVQLEATRELEREPEEEIAKSLTGESQSNGELEEEIEQLKQELLSKREDNSNGDH